MGLLFVTIPFFAGVGLAVALSRRPVISAAPEDAALLSRLTGRTFVALLIGAVAAAAAMAIVIVAGPGAAVAPMVAATVLLLSVCVAELTTPTASGPVRTATLAARTLHDYVSPGAMRLAIAGPLTLIVLLVIGWIMGDPDDLGRAGRAIATTCGPVGNMKGPWPGSFYGLPMLAGLAVALAAAALTLRTVVHRSRPSAESAAADEAARRISVRRVLLATSATGFISSVPVALLMASGVLGLDCQPQGYPALGILFAVTAVACSILGAGTAGAALAGPRLVPHVEAAANGRR